VFIFRRLLALGFLVILSFFVQGCGTGVVETENSPPAAATFLPPPATSPPAPTAATPAMLLPPSATATISPTPLAPTETPYPGPCSPLEGYELGELPAILSQGFIPPNPGKDDGHHGIDLAHYIYKDKTTIAGVPVQAVYAGRIAAAITDSWPYGNFVIVESPLFSVIPERYEQLGVPAGYSLYHLYAHFENPPAFAIGDAVSCGAPLGSVGNTGWSGNYHLHLETRFGPPGVTFPEMAYYQTTTTQAERDNYESWRMNGAFFLFDPLQILDVAP